MTLQELSPYITALAGIICFVSAARKKDFLGLMIGVGLSVSGAIRLLFPAGPVANGFSTVIMFALLVLIGLKFYAARKRVKQEANQPR
jgi:membrane protein implicated in regulation of membrane protease activity